ncbi:RPGF6-like protein [Mya arenaria]|uniref:RPGF6-like protein n=1 Tax=Mya arenaria TaxID=6604 RepID=A0ABY7DGE0_MYAAR|nr:RPGF6-like protein [Mya arenaria]
MLIYLVGQNGKSEDEPEGSVTSEMGSQGGQVGAQAGPPSPQGRARALGLKVDSHWVEDVQEQRACTFSSFGKRTPGCARRASECLILEPSEMIVIDYPDVQVMKPGARVGPCSNMSLDRLPSYDPADDIRMRRMNSDTSGFSEQTIPDIQIGFNGRDMYSNNQFKRCSRASDTSSAYSGSDMMQSSLDDGEELPPNLQESVVDQDSDDEEGFGESTESLPVRDAVRECLEKDPSERKDDDIEILLDFMQHFRAFANMTLATRRALCAVMVFAVVEKAGTIVMKDGEELDSWSVILNGQVAIEMDEGSKILALGDSFGITPTMEKLYHKGTMHTIVDDCQFVCIAQSDYYGILHQGEENTRRHYQDGQLTLVTELRVFDGGNRRGHIVIRGTLDSLMKHLVEDHSSVDLTYVEDFLLTYRTFLPAPTHLTARLLEWFGDPKLRAKVTRVVLLWVNDHFNDFETNADMSEFLEHFEELMEEEILEVNGQNMTNISHSKALELLRKTTHLSITVKSNLAEFKEMLDNDEKSAMMRRQEFQQTNNKQRLSAPDLEQVLLPPSPSSDSGSGKKQKKKDKSFMNTIASSKPRFRIALRNLIPRNMSTSSMNADPVINHSDENLSVHLSRKSSTSSGSSNPGLTNHFSASNPDLSSFSYLSVDDKADSFPEHVVKVTVESEGFIKQKRLPDTLQNLPDRLTLNGRERTGYVNARRPLPCVLRYYLKNNLSTEPLVPDELMGDLKKEAQISLTQLNPCEVASQLTLEDFKVFKEIQPAEYIDEIFKLKSKYGAPNLKKFSDLANKEMFWVVTEICSESNLVKRMKIVKHFIKIARHCKECKNFNSMFAIVSGLSHSSVSRLHNTWEKVPNKYRKMFELPFFPVVNKDLTFIDLGNDSKVEGLVNFEKLRMVAKEVRHMCNMCPPQIDLNTIFNSQRQEDTSAIFGVATMKRAKNRRASTVPNARKMYEEAQMTRRVKSYLSNLPNIRDEEKLAEMCNTCEPQQGSLNSTESQSPTASIKSSSSAPCQYESDSSHASTSTYDNHSTCSLPSNSSPALSRKSSTSSGNHISSHAQQQHHYPNHPPPQSGINDENEEEIVSAV